MQPCFLEPSGIPRPRRFFLALFLCLVFHPRLAVANLESFEQYAPHFACLESTVQDHETAQECDSDPMNHLSHPGPLCELGLCQGMHEHCRLAHFYAPAVV
jgi:hypothetical protein